MSFKRCSVTLALLLLMAGPQIWAQAPAELAVGGESLRADTAIELSAAPWKYQTGDDLAWAQREYADEHWETLSATRFSSSELPRSGWNGHAWFRLHLKVDETAARWNFILTGSQSGAAEIYLDGTLRARFGRIADGQVVEYNPNQQPLPLRFDKPGAHVLAVRFAAGSMADLSRGRGRWLAQGGLRPGFTLSLTPVEELNKPLRDYAADTSMRAGVFFAGILLALAFLHLLLFLFYRVERGNLYYSLYAGALGCNILCGNVLAFGHDGPLAQALLRPVTGALLGLSFIALMAFLQVAFQRRWGRIFAGIVILWLLSAALAATYLYNLGWLSLVPNLTITATFTFSLKMLVDAVRFKHPGAWILIVGVQLLALGMFAFLLAQLKILILPAYVYFVGELFVILAVPVSVSVYLARNFARTNRELAAQLTQVEYLSQRQLEQERRESALRLAHEREKAENERRAQELAEARQLQLSLLPKKVPQLPDLDIAAYMKPATEVGGDYYDFHIAADGTLTVAVGDATGHGLKAGSVVTATKGLFNAFAAETDIPLILRQTSLALKRMNLRGLYMALALLKVKEGQVALSAAGMPAALIYRHTTGRVESIAMRAVPLGSIANFAYQVQEFALRPQDCVLLMSDGFPEMFNESDEILGYEEAATLLGHYAGLSAQEIIDRLVAVAAEWAGTRPAEDDVTFVVLKVKAAER